MIKVLLYSVKYTHKTESTFKYEGKPKTDLKLGKSGRWVGSRTGPGVTTTLR